MLAAVQNLCLSHESQPWSHDRSYTSHEAVSDGYEVPDILSMTMTRCSTHDAVRSGLVEMKCSSYIHRLPPCWGGANTRDCAQRDCRSQPVENLFVLLQFVKL